VRFETAREQRPRERCGSSGGYASKGEPHERSQHETRLGRFEEEKTVKRVRNPVGGTALGLWQASGSSGLLELIRAEEDQTSREPVVCSSLALGFFDCGGGDQLVALCRGAKVHERSAYLVLPVRRRFERKCLTAVERRRGWS
jgi:hypothetical protein